MATTKKRVAKKKVATKTAATKAVAPKAALTNTKLHAVLGETLMRKYERRCAKSGMTKSEVARILVEAFANGSITITAPALVQLEPIEA